MESLEQILTGEAEEEAVPPTVVEEEETVVAPEEKEVKTEPEKQRDETAGLKAALADERRKRQDLERRITAQPQPETPNFWEEPEKVLSSLEERMSKRALNDRMNISEMMMAESHPDLDEKFEVFQGLVQQNPGLYQQLINHPHPYKFLYDTASKHLKMQEMGDPDEFEAKLRAKIRAEMESEYEAKIKDEIARRAKIPGSMTELRSEGGATTRKQYSGPTPLSKL